MPGETFSALRSSLRQELANLDRLSREIDQLAGSLSPQPTTIEIRAAGSILHDYYTGVERMLQRVALELDGELPQGADWHVHLLKLMGSPQPGFRPALFDQALTDQLEEYLRFRHVFRNIYGFELRWELCQPLVARLKDVHVTVAAQIGAFQDLLARMDGAP